MNRTSQILNNIPGKTESKKLEILLVQVTSSDLILLQIATKLLQITTPFLLQTRTLLQRV